MSVYLDTSVIIPTLIEEAGSSVTDKFITSISGVPIISDFAVAEVSSALSRLVRMNLLDPDDATARLSDFDIWRATTAETMDLAPQDVRLASLLVRRFDLMLRAPDALHAAMCQRAGHLLVTMDRRLANAAMALGIPVHLPG